MDAEHRRADGGDDPGIIRDVAIAAIDVQLRPASRMRVEFDAEAIADYAERLDDLPPVVLAVVPGVDGFLVVDGAHRIAAARQAGRVAIRARVLHLDRDEAFRLACRANDRNGLRITRADRRRQVEEALRDAPELTDRQLAERVGTTHKTVSAARGRLVRRGEIPHVESRLDTRGRRQPAARTRRASADATDAGADEAVSGTAAVPEIGEVVVAAEGRHGQAPATRWATGGPALDPRWWRPIGVAVVADPGRPGWGDTLGPFAPAAFAMAIDGQYAPILDQFGIGLAGWNPDTAGRPIPARWPIVVDAGPPADDLVARG